MKNKFIQTVFLFITLCFVSCAQKATSKVDQTEELDFEYSSILIEETTTITDVAQQVVGTWFGNYDWRNTNNKKATYILAIKHTREEFFTITQKIIQDNKEESSQSFEVSLFLIDDRTFVFETEDGKLIEIHYLSDRQLKLGEHIFVKQDTK